MRIVWETNVFGVLAVCQAVLPLLRASGAARIGSPIRVNLVSPGFTSTALNGYKGTESVENGSREVVRVALLGDDVPGNTFTRWENVPIPW